MQVLNAVIRNEQDGVGCDFLLHLVLLLKHLSPAPEMLASRDCRIFLAPP